MRKSYLLPLFLFAAQALTLSAAPSACADDTTESAPQNTRSTSGLSDPSAQSILSVIRDKLSAPELSKDAHADDLAALKAFYHDWLSRPLWMTDMGLSAKGQQALFEVEKAEEWGLTRAAFNLPPAGVLPEGPEQQAVAEIKLNLSILKYARHASGGRSDPTALGGKIFQKPPIRDPSAVLAEIAMADAPDAYLRSLHPQHNQFARLRQALIVAREDGVASELSTEDKRIIMNMERWRWMPEDLGRIYVWSNTPEFMLYVIKDGATIYADKTQVGTIRYATPVLSADMTTVVFNPEWIAPPTVLRENLAPALRKKNYSILKKKGFSVSYQGKAVDPTKIDWRRVNIFDYTFTQRPGPHSNIGKVKFLLPNRHAFVLHDTWPARRKYYQQSIRAVGHDCVRMEKPDRFAKVLLAESNGWSENKVEELWEKSVNERVTLDNEIPVYSTYFTAVADESLEITTYPDLYGLDHKLARALFGDAGGFSMPISKVKRRSVSDAKRWKPPSSNVTRSLQGFPSN